MWRVKSEFPEPEKEENGSEKPAQLFKRLHFAIKNVKCPSRKEGLFFVHTRRASEERARLQAEIGYCEGSQGGLGEVEGSVDAEGPTCTETVLFLATRTFGLW
jgi:hypothetical protein